jgi:hypothetical protein
MLAKSVLYLFLHFFFTMEKLTQVIGSMYECCKRWRVQFLPIKSSLKKFLPIKLKNYKSIHFFLLHDSKQIKHNKLKPMDIMIKNSLNKLTMKIDQGRKLKGNSKFHSQTDTRFLFLNQRPRPFNFCFLVTKVYSQKYLLKYCST